MKKKRIGFRKSNYKEEVVDKILSQLMDRAVEELQEENQRKKTKSASSKTRKAIKK